ncbi:MAG: hypothetical protein J5941_04105, partial [Solobacterium sp.]|nr:hypothetical protein [Solobacterium sp.]
MRRRLCNDCIRSGFRLPSLICLTGISDPDYRPDSKGVINGVPHQICRSSKDIYRFTLLLSGRSQPPVDTEQIYKLKYILI